MCSALDVKANLHVSWRPQSSGILERQHRCLKDSLYITMADKDVSWTEALPYITNAMNISVNASTQTSPYQAVFGCKPSFNIPDVKAKMTSDNPLSYGMNLRLALQQIHGFVKLSNQAADRAQDKRQNHHVIWQTIHIGDEIYLHRPQSTQAVTSKRPWIGPFKVLMTNQNVVKISDAQGKTDWVHRIHIRRISDRNPALDPRRKDDDTDIVLLDGPEIVPVRPDVPSRPSQPKLQQKLELKTPSVKVSNQSGERKCEIRSISPPPAVNPAPADVPDLRPRRTRKTVQPLNIGHGNSKSYN